MICRDTNVRLALRDKQRGFLLNPFRFAGPPATDPNYANVSLLLHGDGTNGGTTFTDNSPSPKTPTTVGGGVNTSTSQVKFGTASIAFPNASGDRLIYSSDAVFGFGSGDFTIEAFGRVANTTAVHTICDTRTAGNTGIHFFMSNTVASLKNTQIGVSSNTAEIGNGGTIAANTWHHVAIARSGTTLRGFVDGVQAFSITDSRTYASASSLYVGSDYVGTTAQYMTGFIDDLRITKGVARYTANFTPPAAPFPNS